MRPSAMFASVLLTARNWRGEAVGPSVVSASAPFTVRNWRGEAVGPSAMFAIALLTLGFGPSAMFAIALLTLGLKPRPSAMSERLLGQRSKKKPLELCDITQS
jgi:hypothetical protein